MVRLMLVLGLVLSLAACGGSRTDGLSEADEETLEALLDAAVAERAQAEADKVAAEAAQVAAEADKVAAEAAQAVAEADRVAAEAAQAAAEADRVAAEADKAIAEADKAAAEAAQATAEADKAIAEADKVASEADKVAAEADKVAAEEAQAAAEEAQATAEAEAQYQLREAVDARQEAADARQEAADARQEAADARGEAETASDDAAAAERERARLAAEAAEQQQATTRAEATLVLNGLDTATDSLVPSNVDANRRASATVAATDGTFTSTQGSSAGRWYATTAQGRSGVNEDTLVVYTNVEAPESEPIRDRYPEFSEDYEVSIVSSHGDKVASSSFPSTSNTRMFDLTRRTEGTAPEDDPNLTAGISGSFDRASGTFTCTSSNADGCKVFNSGATYTFTGDWTFKTSSRSARVSVPDTNYMYFGWWRRTDNTGAFSYNTFSMRGTAPTGGSFDALTGSATYEGPAIGLYAIYQPLGAQSGHGEFKATARFSANFTANTLSGSVTGFDVNPDWSLTLGSTSMSSGTASGDSVSWTIGDSTREGGMWTGAFHSDADEFPSPGYHPDGLTGTFDANYDAVARIRGAYGAHRE